LPRIHSRNLAADTTPTLEEYMNSYFLAQATDKSPIVCFSSFVKEWAWMQPLRRRLLARSRDFVGVPADLAENFGCLPEQLLERVRRLPVVTPN
jgi:hypothetical protein